MEKFLIDFLSAEPTKRLDFNTNKGKDWERIQSTIDQTITPDNYQDFNPEHFGWDSGILSTVPGRRHYFP